MALCLVGAFVFAQVALAQGVSPEAGSTNPYGCPDEAPFVATAPGDPGEGSLQCFATQAEADAYSSGEASGASPSPTASATTEASASAAPEDVNCDDFASQFGAQQYYDFNSPPGDPYNLDSDNDGLACEELAGSDEGDDDSATATAEADEDESTSASASADDEAEELPETGGASVLALGAGALLVIGGLAARRIVRS